MTDNNKSFKLKITEKETATLTFDIKDSKVNILKSDVLIELESHIQEVANNKDIKTFIFESAKPTNFIAGADISEIKDINNKKDALVKVRQGQEILSLIANLQCDTICYINGTTMGGGTELALCFDYRLSSKSDNVKIALPEVNLGVIPGFGGTQRLPRLIGLMKSLPLILTGKAVNYKRAFKIGLTDGFFPEEYKEEKISAFIKKIKQDSEKTKIINKRRKFIDKLGFLDSIIIKKAHKNVIKKTFGHYPAPLSALDVIKRSYRGNIKKGLDIELKAFSELVVTDKCKNLIGLYFANESLKKDNKLGKSIKPKKLEHTATLGAGIMGGGIAWLLSKCDIPVRIKDINLKGVALGYNQIDKIYNQLKKIRKYNSREIGLRKDLVTYGLNYNGFKNMDLVIEAIIEDINIKKSSFSDLEKHINKDTIVASNTSSLSITEMATAFKKPERFIGMHFFNPVNRMPLVEVIPHEKTSKKTIQTIIDLSYKSGKTPILVKDAPGFLVNRILLPYLNEAAFLLDEISDIQKIDNAITDFGMPMGPLTLADNVGIDVGYKVAKILEAGFGERMNVSPLIDKIYNDMKLLGRKSGKGFYNYKGKEISINEKIEKICVSAKNIKKDEIIDRLILIMVNEASKCLEEEIVKNAEQLDLAMIMGTGFPAFRGGLLKYADSIGIDNIVNKLNNFADKVSSRYKPSNLLIIMANDNKTFY